MTDAPAPLDLALVTLGGRVVAANDQHFADRRCLIQPGPSAWQEGTYGPDGKIYDGWETRRRRTPGHDHAVVRLGAPGVVHSVVVDTAHFRGNYPPFASVEAAALEGHPTAAALEAAEWTTIVERSPLKGDAANPFEVGDRHRWTHVRLSIYPDGGVARFRVHGHVVPDPRLLAGTVDVAGAVSGGVVLDSSNTFYSSATNLIRPDGARTIAEGWETARRRDDGNDWVLFRLAGAARLRTAEIDTSGFTGNAPGAVRLSGRLGPDGEWLELMPRTEVVPDHPHRFRLREWLPAGAPPVTHVRLDVYPDGGMARVRLNGELTPSAHAGLAEAFLRALPAPHRAAVVAAAPDLSDADRDAWSAGLPDAPLPPELLDHLTS